MNCCDFLKPTVIITVLYINKVCAIVLRVKPLLELHYAPFPALFLRPC